MLRSRFTHWEDGGMYIGYLDKFPMYLTQGESLDDLKANLLDIFGEIVGGRINPS